MKSLFAFWVPLVCAAGLALPASAQFGRSGALGGRLAPTGSSRPLGGIPPIVPTRPGIGAGVNRNNNFRGFDHSRRGVLPYAYSFYVPNYFDDNFYGSGDYGYPPAPVAAPPVSVPQQPVIINQYFSNAPAPQQTPAPPPEANNTQTNNTLTPGDPLGDNPNYYLIAYKNHAVYAALAYWLEDKTLHYVTTQNTHNQASLDLIDLDLTKSLNQARDVPFSIAGK
jgi:hypothetical protein